MRELVFEPPALLNEVKELEARLGFVLPPSFRNVLLTISRRVEFSWFASERESFPEPFKNNFCGDLQWSVATLQRIDNGKDGWITEVYSDTSEAYDRVWHNKLAFLEVGNGDYLAVDLAQENYEQIVYLSHDGGDGHGHVLALSFSDLLERWVPLACAGGEDWQWIPFTHGLTSKLDPLCDNSRRWRKILGIEA